MEGQVLLLCAILGLVTAQGSTPAFSTVPSTPGCWYEGLCKNRGDAAEGMIRDIPVTEDTLEKMMEYCYFQCQGEPTCAHFSAVQGERGVGDKCFLLTEEDTCDLDKNADCFTTYGTCNSGPKDCSNNFNCPMLESPPLDTIEWNCNHDSVKVDPYTQQSPEDTRCSLSCPSWVNANGLQSDIVSICVQGVWDSSFVIPTGRDSDLDEVLGSGALPQPDGPAADQISCGCPVYPMEWTITAGDDMGAKVDYDPNDLPGTSFVCDGPYITDDGTDFKFVLKPDMTCQMYCDSYHIATMTCASGEWTGQPELGAWCYAEPQVSDDMGPGTTTTGTGAPGPTSTPGSL